jgi:primary-amine oxidase
MIAALLAGAAGAGAAHPLDALSADEIAATVAILGAHGEVDAATRFALIDLDEPAKAAVLAWRPPQALARRAFVVTRRARAVYEGVVDLTARMVARWQRMPDVQSSILIEEWDIAVEATKADAEWRAAMARRGYDARAAAALFCAPFQAGVARDVAETGRRLLRVVCFDPAGDKINVWGRPIAGITATVDLDERRVVGVLDTGAVPMPPAEPLEAVRPSKPSRRGAPVKRGFTVTGSEVRWVGWTFHIRLDRRAGLIVSLVRRHDGGRARLVLYRGSVAELYVPYMDADPHWAFRAFLDAGELPFGLLSSSLRAGIDCPRDALFQDAVLPDDRGRPVIGRAVVCLFERDTGAPAWRHAEISTGGYAGRAARELVVRTIPTVGNYDYVIDWVLTETGVIRVDVGATGIDQVKGVAARTIADPTAAADAAHGALIAPQRVAINHDHFVSLRLDVDIDGPTNTLVRQRLVPQRGETAGDGATARSLWTVAEEPVAAEGALGTSPDDHGAPSATAWRIVNPTVTTALGHHSGYELRADHGATPLPSPNGGVQHRAGFATAPLWVTAYDPAEFYAAGAYPNQRADPGGLPAYIAQHRPIVGADLVLWVTVGFHHLPRPEDWPLLPTVWHSVSLVPHGFSEGGPAGADRRPVQK